MLASPSPVSVFSIGLLKAGGVLPKSTSLTLTSLRKLGVLTLLIFFMSLLVT